jgi:hypothetical protein
MSSMRQRTAKKAIAASLIIAAICLLVVSAIFHRTIASSEIDPTGTYAAEVSYRTFYSFVPMAPGSSSDKPGFVEIFKKDPSGKRTSLGRIPVPMLQLSGVKWFSSGAVVELVGEWDFEKRTCYYWSEDGNRKIYVVGKPSM